MRFHPVPLALLLAAPLLATLPPPLAEPAISPDGIQIAFVSGADIWIAPIAGGSARPLVSHPSADSRPMFSPDGARLAFISDHTGNGDIYVLTITTGLLLRLTFDDWQDELSAWSPDSRYVYFSNSSYDISTAHDVYRVSADGGTPMPVLADRYAGEYFAVPAPHGDELAFVANGENTRKWFRHGHSAKDASDIYIRRPGPVYQRHTAPSSTHFHKSDNSAASNLSACGILIRACE